MRKSLRKLLYLAITASILFGAAMPLPTTATTVEPQAMEVHFLDVGQGDSILITCDGHAMLIDAGDDTKGTAIQNYLTNQKIKSLDYLILTHPDADHIGGAPVIITKFDISKVFVSNFEKDNNTYRKLIQALDDKRLKASTPLVNSKYSLGTAEFTILAPINTYDTPNDSSIVLLLKNGENTFLFTGDAEAEAEKDILSAGVDISADVYKVGHHGSKSSTSRKFLQTVNPTYAVISCGEGNSYGLPHAETLNTLRIYGVSVYRTDEDGTIIATSDGKNITFNVPASKTWKAGEPTRSSSKSTTGANPTTEAKASDTASQTENSAPAVKEPTAETPAPATAELTYVLNVKTKKFHSPTCNSLPTTNRQDSSESRDSIISQGYAPCKRCNP